MSENLQIRNLEETIAKCNIVIRDVYDAVVGDVHGKLGLIPQVTDMQGRIKVIEENMTRLYENANKIINLDDDIRSIQQLKEELKDLKIKSAGIEKLINDKIFPEVEDTKKKKWWIAGIISTLVALWAFLKFILPFIMDIYKLSKQIN